MKIFKLPDLGEGLVDAEIREWHVTAGDTVVIDDPLVSVETAKAIVDIPSPQAGRVKQCYGAAGEIVQVGDPLLEYEEDEATREAGREASRAADAGTVVGEVAVGHERLEEPASVAGGARSAGVRATPAVRALARRLDVDLSVVTPSGRDGAVTASDVQRVARILADVGPLQPLRGARRSMALNMAKAHAEVVAVTIHDEADIDAWRDAEDVTIRLIRAIVAGCREEPALNAWYDSHSIGRRLLAAVHLGIAVDTDAGLFVPVLRDVQDSTDGELRDRLDALKAHVRARTLAPEMLRGQTFVLTNFGVFGGRFADPVIVPPTVAILGAGRSHPSAVAGHDGIELHRLLPLSLSFDHRAVTGGEASRFLGAVIADLEQSSG